MRDAIPRSEFVIQSHRGAGELAPENSREAFELAWSLGTIPEADLRTTKDGVITAFHDSNFARILPHEPEKIRNQSVEDFTWEELSQMDIGIWKGESFKGQRIPSMAQVFELLKKDPQRRIYVDIKNVDLSQLAREAHAAGLASRLILASTKYEIITKWKELASDSKTLHWMGGEEKVLQERLDKLAQDEFKAIDQLQIHVRPAADGGKSFTPSEDFLKRVGTRLREHHILFQVLPWQSKDPQTFVKLLDLGVASFATDYPDVMAKTVTDYYDQKPTVNPE